MRAKSSDLRLSAIVTMLLLIAAPGRAQDQHANPGLQADALPCYHRELEGLAFLEGDWAVTLSTRLADGKWEDTTATSQIKRDLGGCLLVERFAGTRQTRPFQVLSLFAFDIHSKLFQQTLTDSEHGLLALYQGQKSQSEVTFELELIRDDGSKWTVRRVYSAVTRNSFTVENKHSQDGGKTWAVVVKARYSRKS